MKVRETKTDPASQVGWKRWAVVLALALAVWGLRPEAYAQSTGATLSGTVADPVGAVIPDAQIHLVNVQSKSERTALSNGTGYFSIAAIPPGSYTLKIEAPGFESWVLTAFDLHPGDVKSLQSISMKPGKTEETVTITATVGGVIQSSGEIGALITTDDMQRLATEGRNASELIKMLPGMAINGNVQNSTYDPTIVSVSNAAGSSYTSSGQSSIQTTSDGASIIDPGSGNGGTQTLNMDMVSEIKVSTSDYGVDSERGPTVISAVGKSGSTDFHGTAYMYARHFSLNANDAANKYNKVARTHDKYWYPGGNIGGPVLIPGTSFNRNKKLLFWFGYENYRQQYPGDLLTTIVPTDAMRNGDFSASAMTSICPGISYAANGQPSGSPSAWCYVPTHGVDGKTAITNGQIQNLITTSGAAMMKMIPHANATATSSNLYNYVNRLTQEQNGYMAHGRVDYNLSDNNKLYFVYNKQSDSVGIPVNLWWTPWNSAPYPGGAQGLSRSQSGTFNFTSVLSPTVTNELLVAVARLNSPYSLNNEKGVSRSALNYEYKGVYKNGTDQMPSIQDWSNVGLPQLYMPGFPSGSLANGKLDYTVQDNVSKVLSSHALKAGFLYERTINNQDNPGLYNNGVFTFNPWNYETDCSSTAASPKCYNGVAQLLMGLPDSYTETNFITRSNLHYDTISFYGQDTWQVNRRLSINYGVRFNHLGPWVDSHGVGSMIWDASKYASEVGTSSLPGMTWHAKDKSVSVSGYNDYPLFFYSPRFGIAYDLFGTGRTVLRGGWGAYRFQDSSNSYNGPVGPPLGQATTYLSGNSSAPLTYAGIDSQSATTGGLNYDNTVYAIDPKDTKRGVTYDYNFTVSQELPGNTQFQIGYIGNMSRDLLPSDSSMNDVNLMPAGTLYKTYCNTVFTNLNQAGCKALPSDASTIDNLTTRELDSLRPYSYYKNVYLIRHNTYSNYNALQVIWNKRKGSLVWGINYTWSKYLGINKSNPLDIDANYGPISSDRSHIFNANYSYQEGRFFRGNKLVDTLLNHWEIAGITGIQSGPNLQAAGGSGLNFGFGGSVVQGTSNTAQLTSKNLLGTPDISVNPVTTCNPNTGTGSHTFMNKSCFAIPDTTGSTFQNGPIYYPYMHGPFWWNSDLSLSKDFKITERQTVQFKAAAFNFLNHPLTSFSSSDSGPRTLNYTNAPAAGGTSSASYLTSANKNFGSTGFEVGRRVMNVSLKYTF